MPEFRSSDGFQLHYQDNGPRAAPTLILLHGFTGSSAVWQRNMSALSQVYRVVAPDLRGHGLSAKPSTGHHVARLAMDLRNLIVHLDLGGSNLIRVIAGSLGCAIIWSYAELFGVSEFTHVVFVDQSPLQNYTFDGDWGPNHGNKSCNSATSLANVQATLKYKPEDVYNGTINSCLAYLSHPQEGDGISQETMASDRDSFLSIAQKGDARWFGKLMADHTSLDWRDVIEHHFSAMNKSTTRVLVIASNRSGCFPAAGPLYVVELINSGCELMGHANDRLAVGVAVDWGGHWCYWENPERFNALVLDFLKQPHFEALR